MGTLGKLLGTLSSDPQAKGREFELLARWYLTNAPEYASTVEQVWLWDEWPERWGADAGIDIVVKTRHDTLWAVQAKAYGSNYSVTKRDLDSFLSESSRPDFEYRLLMATTDRIGGTASRTLSGQEKPVGSLMLADLEASVVAWPDSMDDLRPATITRATPRPHQREAIEAAVAGLKERDRGKIVMACGTGKTYVGLWLHEDLDSDLTLVLVPSLSLLKQTLREWTTHKNTDFDYLAICSDETVDRNERSDSFVASTTALGVPVTTDSGDIGRFLQASGPRVVFSTYQSSPRLAEAMAATPGVRFDLAIADEAHRCTGPATSAFSTVLDDKLIPARKRIFMTATPRYYTGRVLRKAGERDLDIASMDNEGSFGPDFYTLLFAEAIEKGLLSDYRVLVVGVSNAMYREYAERGELVRFDGDRVTDARTLAREIGLAKAMRDYDLKRVLTFHSRVKWAEEFAKELLGVIDWMPNTDSPMDEVVCDFVSGKMNAGDREVRLRRLRTLDHTDRVVLSNARCLAEGVDVPGIDGVAFIDPRKSQVDVVQAVGRALRLSDDKTAGTVVISVFVGDGEDAEEAVESSEFEPVWQVIKALRSHDTAIGESLDQLRAINADGRTPITTSDLPDRIEVDLPMGVGADFAGAFATRLVTETASQWEVGFGLLSDYVGREGNARVPARYVGEDGYRLGGWVAARRQEHRSGRLSADRVARLEVMPGWLWNPAEEFFEDGITALERYVVRNGSAQVPSGYIDDDGYRLGTWVSQRRVEYRASPASPRGRRLLPDRVARLEAIPGWTWGQTPSEMVEKGFMALERYIECEGNAQVPYRYVDDDGFRLGGWVNARRKAHRDGQLSAARVARLEAMLGWSWGNRASDLIEEGFAPLERYVAHRGNARVPSGYVDDDGFRLGNWVAIRRRDHRAGQLSANRVARLEAMPGWSWGNSVSKLFEDGISALERYVKREGNSRVLRNYVDEEGFTLGSWVGSRRKDYRAGRLLPDRVARLEAMPGWTWNPIAELVEEGFAALDRYVAREGNARVPSGYVDDDGFTLGTWVSHKRMQHKDGRLSPDHVARLEAMPGWNWGRRASRSFEDGLEALERYVEREGNARVSNGYVDEDGYRLGDWVGHRRKVFRAGRLSPDRVARLEAMPDWTWGRSASRSFEDGLEAIERYVEREGNARVPFKYVDEDGYRLGGWVAARRSNYKDGRLSPDRVARLEAIPGWVWTALTR